MKPLFTALLLSFASSALADHVPEVRSASPLVKYQFDASHKRYADILKISTLIEDYVATTGTVPSLIEAARNENNVYEVAVLGQPMAVEAVFRDGTPFGFSLTKFRAGALQNVLEKGLNRRVSLPIDPQRVGTRFAPVYFVFFRRAVGTTPAHYIVMGTFAQPVARSTMVADGVHLVAISNISVPFIVDVQTRYSFDPDFVSHAIAAGNSADALFAKFVKTSFD